MDIQPVFSNTTGLRRWTQTLSPDSASTFEQGPNNGGDYSLLPWFHGQERCHRRKHPSTGFQHQSGFSIAVHRKVTAVFGRGSPQLTIALRQHGRETFDRPPNGREIQNSSQLVIPPITPVGETPTRRPPHEGSTLLFSLILLLFFLQGFSILGRRRPFPIVLSYCNKSFQSLSSTSQTYPRHCRSNRPHITCLCFPKNASPRTPPWNFCGRQNASRPEI